MLSSASLSIFRHLFASVAEEMGVTLERAAYSPNIKERLDFSCALFLGDGRMLAQAAHIPVHLGAMPASVQAALLACAPFQEGDVIILNDPYQGGNHLPDITLVSPVFVGGSSSSNADPLSVTSNQVSVSSKQESVTSNQVTDHRPPLTGHRLPTTDHRLPANDHQPPVTGPDFFVASRAHHADVGGMAPGSMPLSTEIYQEGIIIPPIKLVAGGVRNEAVWQLILRNVRTPVERAGDLAAQMAAHITGSRRLRQIVDRYGLADVIQHAEGLIDYANKLTRAAIALMPDGRFTFTDYLDDDGQTDEPLPLKATITIAGETLTVDFRGTAGAVRGNLNAVPAIAESAVAYCVRCMALALLESDLPMNDGAFAPVTVRIPPGSLLDPQPPHAVAAGNVETSQRIVDVVFGALAQALPDIVPAAGQGTMNNLTFGGIHSPTALTNQMPTDSLPVFAYYETIGGGAGAGPGGSAASGVHVHMSNTLNTPVEALEYTFPLRVTAYRLRPGSGGAGQNRGGDGLERRLQFLAPATATITSERRRRGPYGLQGGKPGQAGKNSMIKEGVMHPLPGKVTVTLAAGDTLCIETPGGGGWGQATSER